MKTLTLLIGSFIIMVTSIYSQAMYVDDLNNYIIVEGDYETESEGDGTTSTIYLGGSYVFQGKFELGVDYLIGSYKDDSDSYYDYDMSGFAFDLGYHIKNPAYPVNIALVGAYMTMSMDADYLDELEWKVSGNGTGIGAELYKSVIKTETYELIPFVGFHSMTINTKIEDSYGDSLEEDEESTSVSFGVGIKLNNLIVQPTISQSDGESDFSVTFGMILPQ